MIINTLLTEINKLFTWQATNCVVVQKVFRNYQNKKLKP